MICYIAGNFEARNPYWKPRCNGGRWSTVAGNSALLPSHFIDFAMVPAQRFWRQTVSLLDVKWPKSNQWERTLLGKISSYIKRAEMFYSLFKPQLSTFERHFCVFLLCFWGDNTVHVPHILVKGILSCTWDTVKIFTCKQFFFICGSCWKRFFFCLRLPADTFFTCKQFISVFTASANNLFQNFPTPSLHWPRPKNYGPFLRISIQ